MPPRTSTFLIVRQAKPPNFVSCPKINLVTIKRGHLQKDLREAKFTRDPYEKHVIT